MCVHVCVLYCVVTPTDGVLTLPHCKPYIHTPFRHLRREGVNQRRGEPREEEGGLGENNSTVDDGCDILRPRVFPFSIDIIS